MTCIERSIRSRQFVSIFVYFCVCRHIESEWLNKETIVPIRTVLVPITSKFIENLHIRFLALSLVRPSVLPSPSLPEHIPLSLISPSLPSAPHPLSAPPSVRPFPFSYFIPFFLSASVVNIMSICSFIRQYVRGTISQS